MTDTSPQRPASGAARLIAQGQLLTFILIASLFFSWGLAANMTDTLLAAFKRILSLTDFQTAFVQYAFFGGYFCFAIPASILARRAGYKAGILVGLGLYIGGALLFYPASQSLQYGAFLFALYVLAAGLSFLETCANPFIYSLGPIETATRRLNLAQAFNPVGAITGALLAQIFILSELNAASSLERAALGADALRTIQQGELAAVMGPYVAVAMALTVIWLLIAIKKLPPDVSGPQADAGDAVPGGSGAAIMRLLANRAYLAAVLTQFLYVGAQVGLWSFTIRYVMDRLGLMEAAAASYYTGGLVLFFISRFVCTGLMGYIRGETLLFVLAAAASALCVIAAISQDIIGVYALFLVNGCMSLMFPTIYGIGLRTLGPDIKIGGAGLVMAISGGAVVVGIQALVSDLTGDIGIAFIVPALCFVVVALFGFRARADAAMPAAAVAES